MEKEKETNVGITNAGIIDQSSMRSIIRGGLMESGERSFLRIGFVIVQRKSMIRILIGSSRMGSAANLLWLWRWKADPGSESAFENCVVGLIREANHRGLYAEPVSVREGSRVPSECAELLPKGYVPADAVLLSYAPEGQSRKRPPQEPRFLSWIK